MLLAIGTKVRLKNTGDEGVVCEVLDSDLFSVYLSRLDMEIPSSASNLERLDTHQAHAKVVKGKQEKVQPETPYAAIQYKTLKRRGLLLAFQPIYNKEDSVEAFEVYLVNDSRFDLIFNVELQFERGTRIRKSEQLAEANFRLLDRISFAQLNNRPHVHIDCWKVTTKGTEGVYHQQFRLKPKNFFSRATTAPLLDRTAYCYTLFSTFKNPPSLLNKQKENLSTYTQRNVRERSEEDNASPFYNLYDVQARAGFNTELDLHIEHLVSDPKKLTPSEMLSTQLRHFDNFLLEAIRLGVDRCFVIHGVGKGTLRDAVAERLRQHRDVADFKNEYHHRYGWGATEVIF